MKKIIITSIISCIALANIFAQLSSQNNAAFRQHIKSLQDSNVIVTIDPNNNVNATHPYIDFFSMQDNNYLGWLYTTNTINMKLNNPKDYNGPRKILSNSNGNNTIIFQLTQNGVVSYDTLRNSIHPKIGEEEEDGWDFLGIRKAVTKWRGMDALKDRNIRGDLPKGSMVYIEMNGRKEVEVGVLVASPRSDVTIEIINKYHQIVATLVDDGLKKGWSGYKWNRGETPRGKYSVKITVDGRSLMQDIKI